MTSQLDHRQSHPICFQPSIIFQQRNHLQQTSNTCLLTQNSMSDSDQFNCLDPREKNVRRQTNVLRLKCFPSCDLIEDICNGFDWI